jgi:hypothetical protein
MKKPFLNRCIEKYKDVCNFVIRNGHVRWLHCQQVVLFITLFHLLTCAIKKLHNARRLHPTSWQMKNYCSEWYSNLYVCMWCMWEVGQLLHGKGDGAFSVKYQLRVFLRTRVFTGCKALRSFATRVSQLKSWHFWVTGIERNVCRSTFKQV